MKKIIQVVWLNKTTGQKCVTIPKDRDILAGQYVEIIKTRGGSNGNIRKSEPVGTVGKKVKD